MRIAFIMDPIERIDIDADTTFGLMYAAQEKGHEVRYLQLSDLSAEGGKAFGWTQPVTLRMQKRSPVDLGSRLYGPLEEFDVVFMRKDPPFDIPYLHACHLLELVESQGTKVYNRPRGLMAANEKLYSLHFPDAIPPTIVTRKHDRIKAFMTKHGGQCVVKPLDGHGGEGIFVLQESDRNLNAMLELSTHHEISYLMVQAYIPEVRRGDKRILMLNGEPMGAILRVPREEEHRSNIHVGGQVIAVDLTDRDREICAHVGPKLAEDGLVFVGLDVIGDYLTEVNVTSPTGIREFSRLNGLDAEGQVIDWIADSMKG